MRNLKKVAILGHFAFGLEKANGQTVKTKIIGAELRQQLGTDNVDYYDTMGGFSFLMRLPFVLFSILFNHRNVIILPAFKAVCIIVPAITLMNLFFRRSLHYVIIGGRLPLLIERFPILKPALKRLNHIYPETELMANELIRHNINNVSVMPNCKHLDILQPEDVQKPSQRPYKLCTFSRVERTKGIEDAVKAVRECNKKLGKIVFHLDIFGPVQEKEWFELLMENQPKEEISYGGVIPYDQSSQVLGQYYALLFPTYYPGEGFAGTLIDALAAGLPTIASDWKSNKEIVEQGKTGFLFTTHSVEELADRLIYISDKPELIKTMRLHCVDKATQYMPEKIIRILTKNLS